MPNDLLLNILITVVVLGGYHLWRKQQAIKSREIMADKVEKFLAGNADKALKEFVYKFYEASLFSLFSVAALVSIVKKTVKKNTKAKKRHNPLKNSLNKASKENIKMVKGIMSQGLKVILNRAPITTFVCLILLILFVTIQVLIDKMSFNKVFGNPSDVLDDTIKHCN